MTRSRSLRDRKGNMLILSVAVSMGILVPLLLFGLWFARQLGSHQEQSTAIQGAALAAADALARIVVEDSQYGLVGLSDYSPVAPNTSALDGQNLPVLSINSIFATVRLDMIVADQLHDPTMKALAQRDYNNALATKDFLNRSLADAITSSPSTNYYDVDGNIIQPYESALAAYKQNVIRMTGTPNQVDTKSFKLTLGYLNTPGPTNTPVPQPVSYANVPSGEACNNQLAIGSATTTVYKSYANIPYDGQAFVFSGCDYETKLINNNVFSASVPSGLPWAVPSIIKVDADQMFAGGHGNPASITHAIACAQPANVYDPRPAPGALKIDFPDGLLPELVKPIDLIKGAIMGTTTDSLSSPVTGDNPPAPLVSITGGIPVIGTNPTPGTLSSLGVYSWLKRAGVRPNLKAVLDFTNQPFNPSYPTQTVVYEWDGFGNVTYKVLPAPAPGTLPMAANMQLYGMSQSPLSSSNGNSYDYIISDTAIQPGRQIGGLHAGEPLVDPSLSQPPMAQTTISSVPDHGDVIAYAGWLLLFPIGFGIKARRKQLLALIPTVCILSACHGSPPIPPPDKVLTTHVTGARVPRSTYLNNGMSVEMMLRKHTGGSKS